MLIYGGDQTQQRSRATIYRWRDLALAARTANAIDWDYAVIERQNTEW